jgi:hypothetical protein
MLADIAATTETKPYIAGQLNGTITALRSIASGEPVRELMTWLEKAKGKEDK